MKLELTNLLQNVKSKTLYSTDNWMTKQMVFTFAGTIANFINDDWKIVGRLIDFYHIEDKEHKGEHAGAAFVKSAAGRGGLDKMSPCLI